MPEYEILTKKTIEYVYRVPIEPPVDMGPANERICDRFARQIAKNGEVPNQEADEIDDSGLEEIAYIFRNGHQVWPRLRKTGEQKKQRPLSHSDQMIEKMNEERSSFDTGATEEEGGDEE